LEPDDPETCNNLAWTLATSPREKLRNGEEAVRVAEHGCALTGYKKTMFVGTLAAAYAEAGRFEDAVKTAETALSLANAAGEKDLAAKNLELLNFYRARKPYREEETQLEPGKTKPTDG
jgi:hypothetical protein